MRTQSQKTVLSLAASAVFERAVWGFTDKFVVSLDLQKMGFTTDVVLNVLPSFLFQD